MVKRLVPRERLLVFEVREGWGPLWGFLGVERPVGVAFPNVNDTEAYVRSFRRARNSVILRVVVRGLLVLGPLVVGLVWAWWVVR